MSAARRRLREGRPMTDHALTPETLAELEQLRADATPGPWFAEQWTGGSPAIDWEVLHAWMGEPTTVVGQGAEADVRLIAAAVNHLPALIAAARAVNWWADQWEEARSILRYLAVAHLDEFSYDELSTVLDDQPLDHEGENYLGHLTAERDAALAEVAAARKQAKKDVVEALEQPILDAWSSYMNGPGGKTEALRQGKFEGLDRALRIAVAALDVDAAGHDDSSERDGGR